MCRDSDGVRYDTGQHAARRRQSVHGGAHRRARSVTATTLMPNAHRRRRRDSTVELSRVGCVYTEFATSSRRSWSKN